MINEFDVIMRKVLDISTFQFESICIFLPCFVDVIYTYSVNQKKSTQKKLHKCKQTLLLTNTSSICFWSRNLIDNHKIILIGISFNNEPTIEIFSNHSFWNCFVFYIQINLRKIATFCLNLSLLEKKSRMSQS